MLRAVSSVRRERIPHQDEVPGSTPGPPIAAAPGDVGTAVPTGTIAVIAPSNSMADLPEPLRAIGRRRLGGMGYDVVVGAHADRRHFHTAGTALERAEDLHRAFEDPRVDVVLPVFGGYNANQLLDRLDFDRLAASRATLVGYSDTTVLLAAIGGLAVARVVHGPAFATFCDPNLPAYTADGWRRVLAGERVRFTSPDAIADDRWYLRDGYGPRELRPFDGWKVFREGEATGPVVGGNLESLCALAGTRYFPATAGCLLLLEDATGASPGAVHRALTQLAQLGALDELVGLLVGVLPHDAALDGACLRAILDDVVGPGTGRTYPVVYDVTCSHVDPMASVPLFEPAHLTTSPEPCLIVNLDRPAARLSRPSTTDRSAS